MLGDQLIKNNVVALTELAKNSYDADATWVQVRIGNMQNWGKKKLKKDELPFVEIEDDGDGMKFEVIRDAWMNPATPSKYTRRQQNRIKTRRGRIIQGEKGIGRYAVFKIGSCVELFTRNRVGKDGGGREIHLTTDLSGYSEEFMSKKNSKSHLPLYFDQLESVYETLGRPHHIKPSPIIIQGNSNTRRNHGTLIRITALRYPWTDASAKNVKKALSRLESPFSKKIDFRVSIEFEGAEIGILEQHTLEQAWEEATLEMVGKVDKSGVCKFVLNEKPGELDLVESLKSDAFKDNRLHFFDEENHRTHEPVCGPFSFHFYVFGDLRQIASADKELRDFIIGHRTYIYRDGVRVYPYGDRDNDWLKLDILRGTVRASYYLSNDQLMGYVDISSEKNPMLRDKTNREGLLEEGTAYEDLRLLTISALNFLNKELQKEKLRDELRPKTRSAREGELFLQSQKVEKRIESLSEKFREAGDNEGGETVHQLSLDYLKEKQILHRQIELVEDLAGVGLAVDATSHDVMVVVGRARENIATLSELVNAKSPILERIRDKTQALEGQLMFVESLLHGIQPLFRSARRRKEEVRILDAVKKVERYYEIPLKRQKIHLEVKELPPPLILQTAEGILLQILINLFDNSVYWLKADSTKNPTIEIQIDGNSGTMVFADNGPGVKDEDSDYIFEPFFSTKGIQGRGLGLYIARQLADRYQYEISYLDQKREQILPGANFKIEFQSKD